MFWKAYPELLSSLWRSLGGAFFLARSYPLNAREVSQHLTKQPVQDGLFVSPECRGAMACRQRFQIFCLQWRALSTNAQWGQRDLTYLYIESVQCAVGVFFHNKTEIVGIVYSSLCSAGQVRFRIFYRWCFFRRACCQVTSWCFEKEQFPRFRLHQSAWSAPSGFWHLDEWYPTVSPHESLGVFVQPLLHGVGLLFIGRHASMGLLAKGARGSSAVAQ